MIYGRISTKFGSTETGKATYTATIESPTKMTGTVEFSDNGGRERGKWTATKKE
jgi:hypothetical protein